MKKIRKRICQLLVICGCIVIGLVLSPIFMFLLPIILVMWLGGKIVEYANEKS